MNQLIKYNVYLIVGFTIALGVVYLFRNNYFNFFLFGIIFFNIIILNLGYLLMRFFIKKFSSHKLDKYLNYYKVLSALLIIGWLIYELQ